MKSYWRGGRAVTRSGGADGWLRSSLSLWFEKSSYSTSYKNLNNTVLMEIIDSHEAKYHAETPITWEDVNTFFSLFVVALLVGFVGWLFYGWVFGVPWTTDTRLGCYYSVTGNSICGRMIVDEG